MSAATSDFSRNSDMSLTEMKSVTSTFEHAQKIFISNNLGNTTFLMCVPMKSFYDISIVANERQADGTPATQRPLIEDHANKLAKYILKGLISSAIQARRSKGQASLPALYTLLTDMGGSSYLSLQPIVANLRIEPGDAGPRVRPMQSGDDDCAAHKVFMRQQDILYVIDGQHRRYAMEMVFKFLTDVREKRKYPRKPNLFENHEKGELSPDILAAWASCEHIAWNACTVSVEVHIGLNPQQERQLFHDLNNLGKAPHKSLALQFDTANPINTFIREELVPDILGWSELPENDNSDFHNDPGCWTSQELSAVNAILFLNAGNIISAKPHDINAKLPIARRFWAAVKAIPSFGEPQAKTKTVAAQPVVIKALARLVYSLAFKNSRDENADNQLELLLNGISTFNFTHENKCWRYYQFSEQERYTNHLTPLAAYLPKNDGSNRDIGGYDATHKWMRFSPKHNDIDKIIGDMIRWELKLPPRIHKESRRRKQ